MLNILYIYVFNIYDYLLFSLKNVCPKNQATNFTQTHVIRNINVLFQTFFDDSALFYASGEPYLHHYIAVSLLNGTVHVEVDFGDGAVSTTIGQGLISNHWNNFTIAHRHSRIIVHLNDESKELQLPGPNYYLYIDPEIYIGGGPELQRKKGSPEHGLLLEHISVIILCACVLPFPT